LYTQRVFFYTIGGSISGFGHLARMLPLFDSFIENDINTTFIVEGDDVIYNILENRKTIQTDWLSNKETFYISHNTQDIVIVDTLEYPTTLFNRLRHTVRSMYFVCDSYLESKLPFGTHVLNWRVNAELNHIRNQKGLFGSDFVPLRQEIFAYKRDYDEVQYGKNIFISMGSGDILNLIPKTLEILFNSEKYRDYKISAVIGKHHKQYKELINRYGLKVNFLINGSASELFSLISKSTVAIASGGHSIYEFAYLGIPTLHVLTANNQKPALSWDSSNFTYPIGWYDESIYSTKLLNGLEHFLDFNNWKTSRIAGMNLVDGGGASRVVKSIIQK